STMRLPLSFFVACMLVLMACNSNNVSSSTTDSTSTVADSTAASTGSTDGFKLGVQMWTFRMFTFKEALDKLDSAGIKNIEAFWGQKLGGNLPGEFGATMSADTKTKLKKMLQDKGIQMVAMGV